MADGETSKALRASLSALGEPERDQAAMQLARRYAVLLDQAAVPSGFRAAFARLARLVESDADAAALEKVRDALSAHSVASDLGPKYLAVLAQLGLTPAGRAGKPAEPAPVPGPKPEGKRDDLKARRDERRQRAAGPR